MNMLSDVQFDIRLAHQAAYRGILDLRVDNALDGKEGRREENGFAGGASSISFLLRQEAWDRCPDRHDH